MKDRDEIFWLIRGYNLSTERESAYYWEGYLDFVSGYPCWDRFDDWKPSIADAYCLGYADAKGDKEL